VKAASTGMAFHFFVLAPSLAAHIITHGRRRGVVVNSVVRRVGAPYRRARIPGSSDLRVCVLSANKDIALRTRCFHLIIQQTIH